MKQITANEFRNLVESNPAWASTLTEPIEIIGYCDLKRSRISHLSPLLHFPTHTTDGDCATFAGCKDLKVAEGNFAGWVSFSESGIEKIGELTITAPDHGGRAAAFLECKNLKVATGTFPGYVNFSNSGITSANNLQINNDNHPIKANFTGCDIRLPAEYLGSEYQMDDKTRRQNLARIATKKAVKESADMEI